MGIKVLFVYPNYKGMYMLPPAIGLLSSVLKNAGHQVRLFDTTQYNTIPGHEIGSDESKAERLMARPFDVPPQVVCKDTDVFGDFVEEVEGFKPDLIALSVTEDMFELGIALLERIRRQKILTICGGVFPTFAPELVLGYEDIDIICKGEGEDALLTLCNRLKNNEPIDNIGNLWLKKNSTNPSVKYSTIADTDESEFISNPISTIDMNSNPLIDMSLFDESRYYRPMGGKVYRMFPVETFRGCPYKCAFCNSPSQMQMYREIGKNYLRRKTFDQMREELLFYKNEMKAEYLYFWADTFFSWGKNEFEQFAEMYQDIGLPFWCQTRIETIREDKFKLLKDIGCARISFGLEHGNQAFRSKHLDRKYKNELVIERLKIVNKIGIPFSVNNIIGFPHETYELAFDTIELNRKIDASDRNAYPFTPFHGTPLRKVCEDLGYLKDEDIVKSCVEVGSILDMPQFPRDKVMGLVKTFNFYVKFPKSKWPVIKLAEGEGEEANRIYLELKEEFEDRFFDSESENFEEAAFG